MVRALEHRGPDGAGHGLVGTIGQQGHLFHTRLAIIDPSPAGMQPMVRGPLTMVYNGECYNHLELRSKLNGPWKSTSDTETVLALWERHGEACLPMLDGMFALAVYDAESRTLTLARDRAGEKPCYYTYQNGTFAFASELRALTHVPGLSWEIDPEAFNLYMLLRFVPHPYSIIKGIHKLSPGHVLTFKDGEVKTKRWHSWEVDPRRNNISQTDFLDTVSECEALLIDSVKKRLISDRPLGMFLSGGIDSSLTCAIAAKALGVQTKTFSIGFEGDPKSEHQRAKQTAELLGLDHHERIFSAGDFEQTALTMGESQDEPNGDRSCVPARLVSSCAREFVVVALSGDGADELFGGYSRYAVHCGNAEEYYRRLLPVGGPEWAPGFVQSLESLFTHRESIHALRQIDFNHYLPGVLAKMDRTSMQVGLEVRTPYLSPDLLDFSRRLPTQYLIGNIGKLILRQLAAKYIDRELASLPKKGFGMPKSVFEGNSRTIIQACREASETIMNLDLDPEIKTKVLQSNKSMNELWAIIVFGQWAKSFPVKL